MQFLEFDQDKGVAGGMGALVGMATPTLVAGAQHVGRYLKDFCVRRCSDKPSADRIIQEALNARPLSFQGLIRQVERLEQVFEGDALGLAKALPALGKAISFEAEGCCDFGRSLDQLSYLADTLRLLGNGRDNNVTPLVCYRALVELALNLQRDPPLTKDDVLPMMTRLVLAASRVGEGKGDRTDDDYAIRRDSVADFAWTLTRLAPFKDVCTDTFRQAVCQEVPSLRLVDTPASNRGPSRDADSKYQPQGEVDSKSSSGEGQSPSKKCSMTDLVLNADRDKLRGVIGKAVTDTLRKDQNAYDKADTLLEIYNALARRTDLNGGIFMAGLLTPEQVRTLCVDLEKSDNLGVEDANRMAALPRLCQFYMDPALLRDVQKKIEVLAPETSIRVMNKSWRLSYSDLVDSIKLTRPKGSSLVPEQQPVMSSLSSSAEKPSGGVGASLSSEGPPPQVPVPLEPASAAAVKEVGLAAEDFTLVEPGAESPGVKEGTSSKRRERQEVEGEVEMVDIEAPELVTFHSSTSAIPATSTHT